jgi:dUTP pyrophosphatase
MISFKKLDDNAFAPLKKHKNDAGYDLFAFENVLIPPGEIKVVKTMIAFNIPPNFYGRIAGRSGLALHHGIDVLGGVIDSGYTGSADIILINHSKVAFEVNRGMKIAQIIFTKIYFENSITLNEVQSLNQKSDRNTGGFGSSGIY